MRWRRGLDGLRGAATNEVRPPSLAGGRTRVGRSQPQASPDWRPTRGLQGLAGLRGDAPSEARSADGERAGRPRGGRRSGEARSAGGSRAGRRPPAHTAAGPIKAGHAAPGTPVGSQAAPRANKRLAGGDQQELLTREAVDLVHDEATHGTHPRDGCDAEDARTPGPDLQEVLETVSGSGRCG